METEKKQTDEKKELRTGFTTGTCAAACTRAAVLFLCTGEAPAAAETVTPSGVRAILPIIRAEREEDSAVCGVQKDSGDDPDVTNGTLVCARAVLTCHDSMTKSGYTDPAYPGIEVTGGEGIGMVTRGGLSCPVGHYAINPVPRAAIFREAALARREAGMPELPLRIEISIPAGRELAEKTFNPHLGIIGGISVLGTTGIETSEIITSVCNEVKPDIVIAIDSLASSSINRLGTTIQLSNTGITPGAGVRNKREGINQNTLNVPVIAIGVPTVVDMATITSEAIDKMVEVTKQKIENGDNSVSKEQIERVINIFNDDNKYNMIANALDTDNFIVTPKEIDDVIQIVSDLISSGINMSIN